jgi:hypoxanthine-DNA glycosylase
MNKKGLEPVYNENTEILILGSCPGDESIKQGKYYSSPNNQFWKLLSPILNIDLNNLEYKEKIDILLKNKIGLWDVMHNCVREGSLDYNIKSFEPNDFSTLNISNLKLILFNGKKAYENKDLVNLDIEKKLLSSSSGANSISFQEKLDLWKKEFGIEINNNIESFENNSKNLSTKKDIDINNEIQRLLREKGVSKAKAVDVGFWLDQDNILKDSTDRPGLPLRKLLRDGKIKNSQQENGRYWFIYRED